MSKFNIKKLLKKEDKIEVLTMKDNKDKNNFLSLLMTSLTVIVLILTGISISTNSFSIDKILRRAGIYTQEIKSVEIESDTYDAPGSFKIDKSAKWIGKGKAQVIFDVNSVMKTDGNKYHDVILVLDISGSMDGEKLDKAKSDSIELIDYLLNDSHNKVAIITFDSTSEIISSFSNDKEDLINKINNLSVRGATDYNSALNNVDVLMGDYQQNANRDIVTLFLTDGYPNEDTPNQVGTRDILKDKYPYLAINGIQYEMGKDIIEEIKQITDRQWVADQSTLNNVLFDAAVSPVAYEDFIVTDYIHNDYFKINSVDDIKVTMGTVDLTDENGVQKITWNLGKNSYMTGGNAKMYINLNQKEEYLENEGYYPTNKKENVSYKLPEEAEKTVSSSDTPVLKNVYEVIYDTNAPDGCTLESIPKEKYFIFQNVTKKTNELSCEGYLFKGWEFDSKDGEGIIKVNDDVFQMPGHDVVIRGTWSKQDISKSMDGTVHEKMTLYKVLENAAKEGTYAKEYTGEHQDSMDPSKSTEKIYHWYGSNETNGTAILDKNNVIFANHCWQMIRTTDTGGVKMLYNGEVENGKCLKTRETHVGYVARTSQNLASAYWYGTDYTYDSSSKTFKLGGTTEQATWNATTGPGLIGKYTCKNTNVEDTCSTIYLVESYYDASNAYVIPQNSNSHYSQIGSIQFNAKYNSPSDVGYMYNVIYPYQSREITSTETLLSSGTLRTTYWYANDVIWGNPTANRYNLDNPYQITATTDYPNLVGKYTFGSTTQTYTNSSVYYIATVDGTTMYYIQLNNFGNHTLADFNYTYTYGDSYTDNGDGTYTINNPITVERKDWYINYPNLKNKYVCKNATNNTCKDLWYITLTSKTSMTYTKVLYKYSNGFTWDGSKYILDDDDQFSYPDSNHHYTCWNKTGECTSIYYIYHLYLIGDAKRYYIQYTTLKSGKSIEDAINEMLYNDDVNTNDSIVKKSIDIWYERNLIDYSDYLEDTIFCNNRSQRNADTNGWNPNGGGLFVDMDFKETSTTSDLSCENETDRFSALNNKAELKYKIGLMSIPEVNILGNHNMLATGKIYWLGSPSIFTFMNYPVAIGWSVSNYGGVSSSNLSLVGGSNGVRPAVSLIPDIEYSDRDGSMEHPYIVDIDE